MHFIYVLIILFSLLNFLQCSSVFDYVPSFLKFNNPEEKWDLEVTNRRIPYEVNSVDEKFIQEASKLTGLTLSELDSCQQRVVLKIQTSCDKMNDEQVSKLAVMLLNCQSAVEGRELFPCTEQMSIGDCTKKMNPDVWNSYHLMTNRARAVCYSVRQFQFRGLTEMTVNKLMDTAQKQIKIMTKLSEDQNSLKETYLNTIEIVQDGQNTLREQQKDLQSAQFFSQLQIEDNLQTLIKEKALIATGHEQLAKMAEDIKNRLESASKQINEQSSVQKAHYEELLKDLVNIKQQTDNLWNKIDESSNMMFKHSKEIVKQYRDTSEQLKRVNETVHELLDLFFSTRNLIDEKLTWLTESLGGTGNTLNILCLCLNHTGLLIVMMLACAFINATNVSRLLVMIGIPLNLLLSIKTEMYSLDVATLALLLVTFIFGHLSYLSIKYRQSRPKHLENGKNNLNDEKSKLETNSINDNYQRSSYASPKLLKDDILLNGKSYHQINNNIDEEPNDETDDINFNDSASTVSTIRYGLKFRRIGESIVNENRSRSRSNTPVKRICSAFTRLGTPCKNAASDGRDKCFRHLKGSSVIND